MKKKTINNRKKWDDFTLDEQFTIITLVISLFFITLHYILAFLNKDAMIELAVTWVGSVLFNLVRYSIKSFKGKREEENLKYKREKEQLNKNNLYSQKPLYYNAGDILICQEDFIENNILFKAGVIYKAIKSQPKQIDIDNCVLDMFDAHDWMEINYTKDENCYKKEENLDEPFILDSF